MKNFAVTKTIFVAGILAFVLNGKAATTSGVISGSETWSGTIFLTGDVTVAPTGALTILPGTIVQSDAGADDRVAGADRSRVELIVEAGATLTAAGTELNPILFTSAPAAPATQAAADWYGIHILSENVVLKFCKLEWTDVALTVDGFHGQIENCVIQSGRTRGINAKSNFIFVDSILKNSGTEGIWSESPEVQIQWRNCAGSGSETGINAAGPVDLLRCNFTENSYAVNCSSAMTLESCIISRNHGGISAGGDLRILNSTIDQNSTFGIYTYASVEIDNCEITRNGSTETSIPDGVAAMTGPVAIQDTLISDNFGAGVRFIFDGNCVLSNNIIRGNQVGFATEAGSASSDIALTNCLIYANSEFEIRSGSLAPIIADGNYWGEPTTSELDGHVRNLTKIFDTRDEATVGQVAIRTWLATPLGVSIAPAIVQPPQHRSFFQGARATLSVLVNGSGPLSFQWLKGGAPVPGGTAPTLVFDPVAVADSGSYSVRISNSAGSVTSDPAILTVVGTSETPLLSLQMFAALGIEGTVGRTYSIQYTTNPDDAGDWKAWTTIATFALPTTPFVFVDPGSAGKAKRFYRAVLSP